ncbi:hypothetical protein, partial [Hungatella hathewayi]
YILPTTGRIPDLHRLETCAAGRTHKARKPSFYRQVTAAFRPLPRKGGHYVMEKWILAVG